MRIAVTTPTGHVGSRVVQLLVQAGVRPTVLLRDPGRLDPAILAHVDTQLGDLGDADFVRAATKGVDALFWVDPTDFAAADADAVTRRLGRNVTAAVTANEIARTVFQSSVGAEKRHGAGLIDGLAHVEELLDATGASVLHLRCGYFFTNLLMDLDTIRGGTVRTTMPPDEAMPWVDPRDIGDVVAARLLSADWSGRVVQAVHGPQDLTWTRVADIVGDAIGRRIALRIESDEDVRRALLSSGVAPRTADGVIGMTSGLRVGFSPEQRRDVFTTTPTTLGAWAYANLRPALHS